MEPNLKTCWKCGEETTFHIYRTRTGEFRTCEKCEEELNR